MKTIDFNTKKHKITIFIDFNRLLNNSTIIINVNDIKIFSGNNDENTICEHLNDCLAEITDDDNQKRKIYDWIGTNVNLPNTYI